LFLKAQGTTFEEEKAFTTSMESYSNQSLDQPLLTVVSMAIIAPTSSAFKEKLIPRLKEKAPKNKASEFLNIHPQEERPGLSKEAPSQVHLTQLFLAKDGQLFS
jgi:hypothetical protein